MPAAEECAARCLHAACCSMLVALAACGANPTAGPVARPAGSAEATGAYEPASDAVCFEPEASVPDEATPPLGLATDDLPDAERWSGAPCVDESVLAPAVERYREHNLRVASEHLSARGLTLLRLPQSDHSVEEIVELDTIVEDGGDRWLAGTRGAVFARDRCGTIHRLGVHHDGASAIQRTANVCGCFAGSHSMLSVGNWWMDPSEVPAPPPPRGTLMRPEPARNYLYALPEGAETGAPINVIVRGTYRLLTHGMGQTGPCQPPP